MSRGSSISDDAGGVKSKFQQSVSSAPSSAAATTTTTTTVYIQSHYTDATENKEGGKEKEAVSTTTKDSAIDLGVIALVDKCLEINTTTLNSQEAISNHSDSSLDNTLVESTLSPDTLKALSLPPPTPASNLSPTKLEIGSKTKKKVSAWSPRRIFQSSDNTENSIKKKKSSRSFSEEKTKHFNISSLFSRSPLSSSSSTTTTSYKKSTDSKGKKTTSKSVLLSNAPSTNNLSKDTFPSVVNTPKKDIQLNGYNHTRLPIHTERAIYRLSHLKLSNPRRPLCDQVTISNLMFWYLSIISQQNNSMENEFSSTSSLLDPTTGANSIGFTDKENNAMAKKVSRIKLQQQQPPSLRGSSKKYTSNNNNNRRVRYHQIGPAATYSNAMDTLKQQQRLPPHITRKKHGTIPRIRSSNSSSEEEEDEEEDEFSDDEISDDGSLGTNSVQNDDEGIMTDLFFGNKKRKKNVKKYSLFNITKKKSANSNNNNNNNNSSWLPSFASPKQHNVIIPHQDEDDIPLAMYQKGKS